MKDRNKKVIKDGDFLLYYGLKPHTIPVFYFDKKFHSIHKLRKNSKSSFSVFPIRHPQDLVISTLEEVLQLDYFQLDQEMKEEFKNYCLSKIPTLFFTSHTGEIVFLKIRNHKNWKTPEIREPSIDLDFD
jgi:hypothetical protein